MSPSLRVVVVLFIAQAAGAVVVAAVLAYFHRRYRKQYLSHWALSWCCFAVSLGTTALAASYGRGIAAPATLRFALGLVLALALLAQALWLILGARELAGRRPLLSAETGWLRPLAVPVAAGVALAFAWALEAGARPDLVRIGFRSAISAAAFGASAWLVWRARERASRTGLYIVAASFLVFALQHVHFLVLSLLAFVTGSWAAYAPYLGVLDLAVQWVMGLGIVVSLLEGEYANATRAAEQAEQLAYHDVLTGLPNRQLFTDRLQIALARASRNGGRLAVMFMDLDQFKLVNDSLGHHAGDGLLRQVARRIRDCVRDADTLARLGGDEFTMFFPELTSPEDAARIARKILDALGPVFRVDAHELCITGSIGISMFPEDGRDTASLVQAADAAMYIAKARGRNGFQFSSADMIAEAARQLEVESAFRCALDAHALTVYYQPITDVRTGQVRGCEALVRWVREGGHLVAPVDFIRIAQRSGLVPRLDAWVLNAACMQTRRWHTLLGREITIAVNLAATHFLEPDLVCQVTDALMRSGLPPHCLELEVTEGLTMESMDATLTALHTLKNVGVRVSIDDFGAGYSSLAHLTRFPVDSLKVDRSLIADVHRDAGTAALVSTIAELGRSLGLSVVAEGVESEAQLAAVRRAGCHLVQGYLLGRPGPAADIERLLQNSVALPVAAMARA